MYVLYIIFLVLSILIGAPTLLFGIKLLLWNGKTKAKTIGKVGGYSFQEEGTFFSDSFWVSYPIFDFTANGREYTSKLEFSRYKLVDRVEDAKVVFRSNGKPSQKLVYCKDGHSIEDDPLKKSFPLGYPATVYYDPKDPEHNYVIRRKAHRTFPWFLLLTIVNIGLTGLFYVLSH